MTKNYFDDRDQGEFFAETLDFGANDIQKKDKPFPEKENSSTDKSEGLSVSKELTQKPAIRYQRKAYNRIDPPT